MNNTRRKKLTILQEQIEEIMSALDDLREEEETAMYNLPESLLDSDRGNAMQDAVNAIEDAISALEEASDSITEAKGE